MSRPTVARSEVRAVAVAGMLFLVVGCASYSGPRIGDPIPTGGGPTSAVSGEIVVEYYVQCGICDVEYVTSEGPQIEKDTRSLKRVARFSQGSGRAIMMVVTPTNGGYVVLATITVEGREVSRHSRSRGPNIAGQPVVLNATLSGIN